MMSVDVRRRLRESWGFCPRHSWAFACAECEIHRGDPVSIGVLYEDLTVRAAGAVRSLARRGSSRRRLRDDGRCFSCEAAGGSASLWFAPWTARTGGGARPSSSSPPGRSGSRGPARYAWAARVSSAATTWWVASASSMRFSPMLWPRWPDDSTASRIRSRYAAPASEEEQSAWIEALGWFAGWDYPRRIIAC